MQFLILAVFGAICAILAANKGRSAIGWFFIGFFFPLIGLIVILVISNLKEEEAKVRRLDQENRRLREQVRKERMVANRRHGDVQRRLAAHDRVLALDTAPPPEEEARLEYDDGEDGAPPPPRPPRPPRPRPR